MSCPNELVRVHLQKDEVIEFEGQCLACVAACNHDGSVRRVFSVYEYETGYVAQWVDNPHTENVELRGEYCSSSSSLYDFFGNEPLANYLYGVLGVTVPGLQSISSCMQ